MTDQPSTPPASPASPASPADLPDPGDDGGDPAGPPAYDSSFGREAPAEPSWVPQRSGAQPTGHAPVRSGPPEVPASRTLDLRGGQAARLLGGRLQAWHVVAIVAGLLIPAGVWAVASLTDDPLERATTGATRVRPTLSRPAVPSRSIAVPQLPGVTSPAAPRPPSGAQAPTRSPRTAPPPIVKVPDIPVTPVPTDARTIRFESYAAGGARVEVSLSDARHTRYDYPVRTAPVAFETPIGKNVSSNDYYSLRVRLYDPTGSGDRGAVSCRILVDGIVVTSQQGRGYANCYISPYYDIQRR